MPYRLAIPSQARTPGPLEILVRPAPGYATVGEAAALSLEEPPAPT